MPQLPHQHLMVRMDFPPATRVVTGSTSYDEQICAYNCPAEVKAKEPQVWIRIRPSPSFNGTAFDIGEDGKSLHIPPARSLGEKEKIYSFPADGILAMNASQAESYERLMYELVEKAMVGISGVVLAVGSEFCGKSFTLYGPHQIFAHRGLIPRTLDHIYLTVQNRSNDMKFRIFMSAIEIRQDRIKDLLTLYGYEINYNGTDGPRGMRMQEIFSVDEGTGLLIRVLHGQKNSSRKGNSKFHTIVYLDIVGETILETTRRIFRSRITFANIASMPSRDKCGKSKNCQKDYYNSVDLNDCSPIKTIWKGSIKTQDFTFPSIRQQYNKESNNNIGTKTEENWIRRDLSFLEQMFMRENELCNHKKWLKRTEDTRLTSSEEKSGAVSSCHYRQCKLSQCLKDILSGTAEIRLIFHVRPEPEYLPTSLEVLTFASKIRAWRHPNQNVAGKNEKKIVSAEETVDELREERKRLLDQLSFEDRLYERPHHYSKMYQRLDRYQVRLMQYNAEAYCGGRLDLMDMDILSRVQVRAVYHFFKKCHDECGAPQVQGPTAEKREMQLKPKFEAAFQDQIMAPDPMFTEEEYASSSIPTVLEDKIGSSRLNQEVESQQLERNKGGHQPEEDIDEQEFEKKDEEKSENREIEKFEKIKDERKSEKKNEGKPLTKKDERKPEKKKDEKISDKKKYVQNSNKKKDEAKSEKKEDKKSENKKDEKKVERKKDEKKIEKKNEEEKSENKKDEEKPESKATEEQGSNSTRSKKGSTIIEGKLQDRKTRRSSKKSVVAKENDLQKQKRREKKTMGLKSKETQSQKKNKVLLEKKTGIIKQKKDSEKDKTKREFEKAKNKGFNDISTGKVIAMSSVESLSKFELPDTFTPLMFPKDLMNGPDYMLHIFMDSANTEISEVAEHTERVEEAQQAENIPRTQGNLDFTRCGLSVGQEFRSDKLPPVVCAATGATELTKFFFSQYNTRNPADIQTSPLSLQDADEATDRNVASVSMKAWRMFIATEKGKAECHLLKLRQTYLRHSILEYNDITKKSAALSFKLVNLKRLLLLKRNFISKNSEGSERDLVCNQRKQIVQEIEECQNSLRLYLVHLDALRSHFDLKRMSTERSKILCQDSFKKFCQGKFPTVIAPAKFCMSLDKGTEDFALSNNVNTKTGAAAIPPLFKSSKPGNKGTHDSAPIISTMNTKTDASPLARSITSPKPLKKGTDGSALLVNTINLETVATPFTSINPLNKRIDPGFGVDNMITKPEATSGTVSGKSPTPSIVVNKVNSTLLPPPVELPRK